MHYNEPHNTDYEMLSENQSINQNEGINSYMLYKKPFTYSICESSHPGAGQESLFQQMMSQFLKDLEDSGKQNKGMWEFRINDHPGGWKSSTYTFNNASPLHVAVFLNNRKQMKDLLEKHKLTINTVCEEYEQRDVEDDDYSYHEWKINIKNITALHLALVAKKYDVAIFLLEQGANPDIKARTGTFSTETARELIKKSKNKDLIAALEKNDGCRKIAKFREEVQNYKNQRNANPDEYISFQFLTQRIEFGDSKTEKLNACDALMVYLKDNEALLKNSSGSQETSLYIKSPAFNALISHTPALIKGELGKIVEKYGLSKILKQAYENNSHKAPAVNRIRFFRIESPYTSIPMQVLNSGL